MRYCRMSGAIGVAPLSISRSIVATSEPNETAVLEAIRDLGLEPARSLAVARAGASRDCHA